MASLAASTFLFSVSLTAVSASLISAGFPSSSTGFSVSLGGASSLFSSSS